MKQCQVIQEIEAEQLRQNVPSFCVGDTVCVHQRIIEGEKERIQMFTGTVIARRGGGLSETFSLYRFSYGTGVERVFLLHSPKIAKIEVTRTGKVRKAKLHYLRGSSGKASKVKELIAGLKEEVEVNHGGEAQKQSLQLKEGARLNALMRYEDEARLAGYLHIAGVDEAGRGPLAGPVVAAACILPEELRIKGINDSKKLLPSERFAIFQKIISIPGIIYGVGFANALLIDQINILRATFEAMLMAISHLNQRPDYLLIDGNQMPPTEIPGRAIVRGDERSQSIAAASIIAKETRDEIMRCYHKEWPHYGFDQHKGYPTPAHILALREHGPCPIHRLTFAGVV